MVGDLAVLDTLTSTVSEMNLAMSWSDSKKWPLMNTVVRRVRIHEVPLPWTASVFRRTMASAASDEVMLLI